VSTPVAYGGPLALRLLPWSSDRGISALELLIIVVVVCSVFAIGIPVLHRGADAAVLDSNLQSLGTMVNEQVAAGYSPAYRASGEGDPNVYVSSALEQSLVEQGAPLYANPFTGRDKGTGVVNSHTVSFGSAFVAPAVLITDWSDCMYATFPELPLGERHLLAGTLVVAFDTPGQTIDVYFVDQRGTGSVAVVSVPTSPVRTGRHG
jgi:hypothetical protein